MTGAMLAVGAVSGSAQQSCRCIQLTSGCSAWGGLAVWPSARGRAVSRSRTSAAALCGGWLVRC